MQKKKRKKTFSSKKPSFVVGIGASAGGLEAITEFLKFFPVHTGMALVFIQHLDPTKKSMLGELLQRQTKMPVSELQKNTTIVPDHLYVLPSNKNVVITDDTLHLSPRSGNRATHLPIDTFFRSLAASKKHHAIGIVLSGSASDGTLGLEAIKAEGGITFVQDKTAKYQSMPNSAIAQGVVDFVLSPRKIAGELLRVADHPFTKKLQTRPNQEETASKKNLALANIFRILERNTNSNFTCYKESTIERRILRRMVICKIQSMEEYSNYLLKYPAEIQSLYQDFLINVTSFFRDPVIFSSLKKEVFPHLLKIKTQKDPLRIWVPACATGQEAYSIAICLSEFLESNSLKISTQIFATDISQEALTKARTGTYSKEEISNVSPQRLKRFFTKTQKGYEVSKAIREACVFAPQNVLSDPPFSHLHLISCRNLLIYLDPSAQKRALSAFHYALEPKGVLLLGSSESTGAHPNLFSPFTDKKHTIFLRKETSSKQIPYAGSNSHSLSQSDAKASITHEGVETMPRQADIKKKADTLLLSRYVPAGFLTDNNLDILQFRGSTGPYLEPSSGQASLNLLKMIHQDLAFELRSAVQKAKKTGTVQRKEGLHMHRGGQTRKIALEIVPIENFSKEVYFLVLFEDMRVSLAPKKRTLPSKASSDTIRISQLEQELTQAREDMNALLEEQEIANAELRSAHEEGLSSNEELQSLNEELETSKEELEATNEELETINQELQNRNEQIEEVNEYVEAIIRTLREPFLVLDKNLVIKSANAAFYETFHINPKETEGILFYDLENKQWAIPSLRKLFEKLLRSNKSIRDFEVLHQFPYLGRKVMLLNATKFIGGNNQEEFILLSIEDATERKRIEDRKEEIIGIASHELKSPLTTMRFLIEMLQSRFHKNTDTKNKQMISRINKEVHREITLINDLFNLETIRSGKLQLEKEFFDGDVLIEKIIDNFLNAGISHQIIKSGKIREKLYGDTTRIEQVIVNLLDNAIKYSPPESKILVETHTEKGNARISVKDFGKGIPKKEQKKIFERFYQTNKKNQIIGLGLGLYITAQIIKKHRGKIWVESNKGEGSIFYFTLPLKKA